MSKLDGKIQAKLAKVRVGDGTFVDKFTVFRESEDTFKFLSPSGVVDGSVTGIASSLALLTQQAGFVIYRPDDETMEVHLNGQYVGSANHDSDGWAGMESLEDLVTNVAEVLNLPVDTKHTDPPEVDGTQPHAYDELGVNLCSHCMNPPDHPIHHEDEDE